MFAVWPVATDEKGMLGGNQYGVASGHRQKKWYWRIVLRKFLCVAAGHSVCTESHMGALFRIN